MANSTSSKRVSTTTQRQNRSSSKDSTTENEASPKAKTNQRGKGWEIIVDYSPIPSNPIVGDPNDPDNIIEGKRPRKAVNKHESQMAKVSHTIKPKAKGSVKKAVAKTRGPARKPGAARRAKMSPTKPVITPNIIRARVLGLVNQSLQVAEDVSAYMRGHGGHEEHGLGLERDIGKVLGDRAKKMEGRA